MIGQVVSHYRILEKLGEGGMGEVYLAEDLSLARKVAIKFLAADKATDPEARKRFLHEARAQALVTHTNVTAFHEVGEEQDKVFIVMEYIEGQKLSDFAKTEKLSLPEILDLAIQVGEGLQAAHEKGVMHRDINPANILVTSKKVPKITDFGLAKWKGASTITKTGLQMGTDSYMSPEQLEGRKADLRTDIFSFGVVLYELICVHRPFEGTNRETLFYEILYTQPHPLARYSSKTSENLQRIVSKCLAKKPEERYQSMVDLVADLKKEKKGIESGARILPKTKKWLPFLVPAGIGLAVLLFLIFKPDTGKESAAAENSLAIMYFENLPDPEDRDKTAQMITSLLITDLSESQYMSVVSQQRLYDILNLLGKKDLKVVDKNTASQVAKKAEAKWILTGKIMQAKPNMVVTAEVSEPKGGKILASQRVSGTSGEDLFAVVDKLSAEVKNDLSLPAAAKEESDKPIAEVTTHSPEAYRYYLEGRDYGQKYYFSEAEKSYKKALDFDSTFAMAYYRLSGFVGDAEGKKLIAQAIKYSDKVGQREKYYFKVREARLAGDTLKQIEMLKKITKRYPDEKEAFLFLGQVFQLQLKKPKEAIPYLIKAVEIDPLYKVAYNQLAYAYNDAGDFEKAIWAINKYITLAPNEPNPYDSRGEIYANNGKIELAIESYKKALEIKPDFYESRNKLGDLYAQNGQLDSAIESYKRILKEKPDWYGSLASLGNMYLFKMDYARAESCYRELSSSGNRAWISAARYRLACIPLYQGRFERALVLFDQGIAADQMEQAEEWTGRKHQGKSAIYHVVKKNLKMALGEMGKAVESAHRVFPNDPVNFRHQYIQLLAAAGEIAKAEQIARALKKDIEEKDTTQMFYYWSALGWIEWAKGNRQAARTNLDKVLKASPQFASRVSIADAYLEAGWIGEAVTEFEKALPRYDESRARYPYGARIYYLLGLAYEKSGWNQKAIKNYEDLLEIWKNADSGIVEIEDAKQRLAKLKKKV